METRGPKSIIQQLPSSSAFIIKVKELQPVQKRLTLLTIVPRAGQFYTVESAYFSFPGAFTQTFENVSEKKPEAAQEYVFEILLKFGSRIVAKQSFYTTSSAKDLLEHRWLLVGNLESFTSTVVYPGEGISVETRIFLGTYNEETETVGSVSRGEAQTKAGEFILGYSETSTAARQMHPG